METRTASRDGIVTLAAYAAIACSVAAVVNLVLTLVFNAQLRAQPDQDLAYTFDTIRALALAVVWGLLIVVAVGLFRIAQPPKLRSKLGLVCVSLGGIVVVVSQLVVAAGATGGDLLSHVTEAGEVAVGVGLVLVNEDLRARQILSKGLTQTGLVFGVAVAIVGGSLFFNARILSVGLFVTVGFVLWPTWLGVVLFRLPYSAGSARLG